MSSVFDGMAEIFTSAMGDDDLVTYTRAKGSWSGSVKAIYEPAAAMANLMQGAGAVEAVTTPTRFHIAASALTGGWGQGDTIRRGTADWVVKSVPDRPDQGGVVVIEVEAAP